MENNALKIAETRSGKVCVVTVSGRIDSTNSDNLLEQLKGLLSSGEKTILLDCSEVHYLTSAAFRVLLVVADEAARRAARFALCSVLGPVRELFEVGGLLEEFVILGSRDDALVTLG